MFCDINEQARAFDDVTKIDSSAGSSQQVSCFNAETCTLYPERDRICATNIHHVAKLVA